MSEHTTVREKCSCGAEITWTGDRLFEGISLRSWRKTHLHDPTTTSAGRDRAAAEKENEG